MLFKKNKTMALRKIMAILLFFAFYAEISPVIAQQPDHYKEGIEYFNKKDYKNAALHFEQAFSNGLNKPSLYYNMGSTYYRLGEYEKSKLHFSKLTDNDEYRDLAYYNLGLIASKQGDDGKAIEYFALCKKYAKNEKISRLATRQISILKGTKDSSINGIVSLGYGHDSNIALTPSATAANVSGSFRRIYAGIDGILYEKSGKSVIAYARFFSTDFVDTSIYDDDAIWLGMGFHHYYSSWKYAYDADVTHSTYGNFDYQRIYRLTARASNRLKNNSLFYIRLRHEDINSLTPQFDYLNGTRQKIRMGYNIPLNTDKLRLYYEFEKNDRQNTPTLNYSPIRNKYSARYDMNLSAQDRISGEINYRTSEYDRTTTQNRSDDRTGAELKYLHRFGKGWSIVASASYRNNESTYLPSDYDKTVIEASANKSF